MPPARPPGQTRPAGLDVHNGGDNALLVAQGDILVNLDASSEFFWLIQRYGNWPEDAVAGACLPDTTIIILFPQQALERFYIADLTGDEVKVFRSAASYPSFRTKARKK